jgi:hypothetical protein
MTTLKEILKYARPHHSDSEAKFIAEYLLPKIEATNWGYHIDQVGNIWCLDKEIEKHPYLFACHIDTCHKKNATSVDVKEEGNYFLLGEDKSAGCLGADDAVGIYANLKMMEAGVRGSYLFTRGEERGLIGAKYIAQTQTQLLERFKLCVEVDRAGVDEIITEQSTGKCASDTFAIALGKQLGMGHRPSPEGVFTDNSVFNTFIPECVNIAAGYYHQHGKKEFVNRLYVESIVKALLEVDWSALPIERDTSDLGWAPTNKYYNGYYSRDDSYEHELIPTLDDCKRMVRSHPDMVANYLYVYGINFDEISEVSYG